MSKGTGFSRFARLAAVDRELASELNPLIGPDASDTLMSAGILLEGISTHTWDACDFDKVASETPLDELHWLMRTIGRALTWEAAQADAVSKLEADQVESSSATMQ